MSNRGIAASRAHGAGLVGALLLLHAAAAAGEPRTSSSDVWSSPGLRHGGRAVALPVAFEPNLGQSASGSRFVARRGGYSLLLAETELVVVDRGREVVRVRLLGANPDPLIEGRGELPGRSNYLIGASPDGWRTGVPGYARVSYRGVYPGIDMIVYGNEREVEYDWIVAPGADPSRIELGIPGEATLRHSGGDLIVESAGGSLRLKAPIAYQERTGGRENVPARYAPRTTPQSGGASSGDWQRLGITVSEYDPSLPLIIDPVVSFSTLVGGSLNDAGHVVALDAAGNVYVAGQTDSIDFPTTVALQEPDGVSHAFIVKLDPTGTQILYATYLGGTGDVAPFDQMGLVVDGFGSAYLTGETSSTDFPTMNALQPSNAGGFDAFVLKLNPQGSGLEYSTYLGGDGRDLGRGLAVDSSGNAYVVGITASTNFPLMRPLRTSLGGEFDAFVAMLSPAGSALEFSTYLGGSDREFGYDIALDVFGDVYLTGLTASDDFPTLNPLQPPGGGGFDAFVTKLDPRTGSLSYSTHLGGSDDEEGLGIAADDEGNAYVTGWTLSSDFPVASPLQAERSGGFDAYVAKLDPQGSSLVYSTYLGGEGLDFSFDVAVHGDGSAYVVGGTSSPDFPVRNPVQLRWRGGPLDTFLARLEADGSDLVFSTYLGGSEEENPLGIGLGVAVDPSGDAYVAGSTRSTDFPTWSAFQKDNRGGLDAFVTKIGRSSSPEGVELILSLKEVAGDTVLGLAVGNGGPAPLEIELKLWIDSPAVGPPVSILQVPVRLIVIPRQPVQELFGMTLSSALVFPGTTVAARLVDKVTGEAVRESFCTAVPCNVAQTADAAWRP